MARPIEASARRRGDIIVRETSPSSVIGVSHRTLTKLLGTWGVPCAMLDDRLCAFIDDHNELVVAGCWHGTTMCFKDRDTGAYVAMLSDVDVHSVYLLCLSLMDDPRFFPELSAISPSEIRESSDEPMVHRGFELEAFRSLDRTNGDSLNSLNTHVVLPKWVAEAKHLLEVDKTRAAAFAVMFESAVRFLWLHELGHLILGHAHRPRAFLTRVPTTQPSTPYWELEFTADAFAGQHQISSVKTTNADGKPTYTYSLTFAGSLMPFLLSHGSHSLISGTEPNSTPESPFLSPTETGLSECINRTIDKNSEHPPLPCRALLLQDTFNSPFSIACDTAISIVYSELSTISPLFGSWLAPVRDNEIRPVYEVIRNKSRRQSIPWAEIGAAGIALPGVSKFQP